MVSSLICLSTISISFWAELNLGEFITQYFESTTTNIPNSYKYIDVYYTNITKDTALYQSLQKAIYKNSLPNIATSFPNTQKLSQQQASFIIEKDKKIKAPYTTDTAVTTERLQSTLEQIQNQSSTTIPISTNGSALPSFQTEIMKDVQKTLQNNYYNSELLDQEKMSYGAIKGMVEATEDPYTSFFPPQEAESFNDSMVGEYVGIGAYIEMPSPWKLLIISVFEDSPAQSGGLQWWDKILKVNGNTITQNTSINTATSRIKWAENTPVSLTILRENKEITKTLIRKKIEIQSITTDFSNPNTCIIKIASFDYQSYSKFAKALAKGEVMCKSYIIDVRDNPGWSLEEVAKMLDHIVPTGKTSVIVKTKTSQEEYVAEEVDWPKITNKKMSILVNNGSASASEIFAGTAKEYAPNALIVGSQSYGKWTVQEVINYEWGAMLKYTIAKRFTGKYSKSIDGIWITPDVEIENNHDTPEDEQLEIAKKRYQLD